MSSAPSTKPLAVFSGNCLSAICGDPTGFSDMSGKPLSTGDIVLIFTVVEHHDEHGEYLEFFPDHLTVVVSDEWTSYSNGTFRRKSGDPDYYVMGIKGIPLQAPGVWRVMKVKSHGEVVAGEHWQAYGFSYREAPEPVLVAREGGTA